MLMAIELIFTNTTCEAAGKSGEVLRLTERALSRITSLVHSTFGGNHKVCEFSRTTHSRLMLPEIKIINTTEAPAFVIECRKSIETTDEFNTQSLGLCNVCHTTVGLQAIMTSCDMSLYRLLDQTLQILGVTVTSNDTQ